MSRVKLSLYRLTDPARMAEAYRQRMQTTLAPSESLLFAKSSGALVWQGELVLDDSEDSEIRQSGPRTHGAFAQNLRRSFRAGTLFDRRPGRGGRPIKTERTKNRAGFRTACGTMVHVFGS